MAPKRKSYFLSFAIPMFLDLFYNNQVNIYGVITELSLNRYKHTLVYIENRFTISLFY